MARRRPAVAARVSRLLGRTAPAALILLALAGIAPAAAQSFEEAFAAWRRGDHATAYRGFFGPAEQGNPLAQFIVGVMHDEGQGARRSAAAAAMWFRRAAEQGQPHAQNNLGLMYDEGRGVRRDDVEAVRWLRRSAEQDHGRGQVNLARMYLRGRGVPRDYLKAARWLRRAAGVRGDETGAVQWLRQAADRGGDVIALAAASVFESVADGNSDPVRAYAWYAVAVDELSTAPPGLRERAVQGRDRMAAQLSAAELAQARRLMRKAASPTGSATRR